MSPGEGRKALARARRHGIEWLGQVAKIPAHARRLVDTEITRFAGGLPHYAGQLAHAGPPSLNGPVSPHRRWCWERVDLEEVKRVRRAFDVKVNDVILAAIAAGFRELLDARGTLSAETLVRAMVPVSIRSPDEQGVLTNRVSSVLVNLPCGEPDAAGAGHQRQRQRVPRQPQAAQAR